MKSFKSPRTPLSDELKLKIVKESENGETVYSISKKLGRSPSTVRCFLKCYGSDHQLSRKRGRKPKMTEEIEKYICSFPDEISCTKVADEVKLKFEDVSISKETVRVIRQKYKGRGKGISLKEFCEKLLEMKENNQPIAFCSSYRMVVNEKGFLMRFEEDEAMITPFECKGEIMELRVWGFISNTFNTFIVNVNDSEVEKQKVLSGIDSSITIVGNEENRTIPMPNGYDDINPVNVIFEIIQNSLEEVRFRNKEELFAYIKSVWDNVQQPVIVSYCNMFFDNLKTCLTNNVNK